MIQELGRINCVLQYREVTKDYRGTRDSLRRKAWQLNEAAIRSGFFLSFATFPLSTSPDGMLDFAPLWGRFPLSDPRTLCARIHASPIDEMPADSVFDLFPKANSAESTPMEILSSPRRLEVLRTPIAELLATCFGDGDLSKGMLLYGDVGSTTREMSATPSTLVETLAQHVFSDSNSDLCIWVNG